MVYKAPETTSLPLASRYRLYHRAVLRYLSSHFRGLWVRLRTLEYMALGELVSETHYLVWVLHYPCSCSTLVEAAGSGASPG